MLAPGGRLSTPPARCCRRRTKQVVARLPEARCRRAHGRDACGIGAGAGSGRAAPSACSCCPERRRGPTGSIMLVSKRQRPEPERLTSQSLHRYAAMPTITARCRGGSSRAVSPSPWPAWGLRVRADALDGVLEVRSAYVNVDSGVFLLHARDRVSRQPRHPRRVARRHHADLRPGYPRRARAPLLVRRRRRRPDAAARALLSRRE